MTDHQKFADAIFNQLFRFLQHRVGGSADKSSSHVGDNAELALVVAAFGNFQIAEVARRKADARRRQKIDERVGAGRDSIMDSIQHLFILVRPGDGQNARMSARYIFRLCPETSGDNHAPVFVQSFPNGRQRFSFGAVEESTGVDDDGVCPLIVGRNTVSFGAQSRQNSFTVDKCLGTPERDHTNLRLSRP